MKESGRSESTTVHLEVVQVKGPPSRTDLSLDRAGVHGATPDTIKGLFKIYKAVYKDHNLEKRSHLIFNCDENGFRDKPQSRENVLCQTGRKIYQQQ